MDDDIAEAISRLLLVSGGSERAKKYLEAYIEQEECSAPTPFLLRGADLQQSPASAVLPPCFLSPTANPWREDGDTPTESVGSVGTHCLSPLSPSREVRLHSRRRDSTTHHASESQEQTNRSPNVPNWIRPTPPTTPVRAHSYHPKVITRTHSHGVHDTPPPSPAISVPSQISDQPLSTHNFSSTSSPELAGSGRRARMTAQPSLSPSEAHRTSGRIPTRRGGVPGVADLHPNLALVSRNESRLSHSGFETVKARIRADPEYVGELPYIRLLNPQYKVKTLVHHPPANGNGKWYQVSRGKAVGVFSYWDPASLATQGVTKAVFRSFRTRGEAIVAYQIMLLKGEVLLMNENEADG